MPSKKGTTFITLLVGWLIDDLSSYRRKHEKIFDSISLKYLYRDSEKHDIRPIGDKFSALGVKDEDKKSATYKLGLAMNPNSVVSPTTEVAVQRDNTLTYDRHTESWRRGVNYEPCTF